jgi:hypothetical protein
VDFFYLAKVNGQTIKESRTSTAQANFGRGFNMTPVMVGRDVPAQSATFTITGRSHFAAPILEMMGRVYEVSGDTSFTPLPDRSYAVKGVLRRDYSAVWIEDIQTGEVVGRKIEINGSSTLELWEK